MIELPYCLIIEATDEPDFFGFYSPDLEGFTGIGHSVEDCLFQAKWGMQEFVQVMAERDMAIPPRSEEPTVLIKNSKRDTGTSSTEQLIRQHPTVKRLLKNRNWRDAAEAAIAYYSHGQPCQVEGWKESRTWAQVRMVFDELGQRRTAPPDAAADNG
jgi:predicted RNase H-like HicB family nuclease